MNLQRLRILAATLLLRQAWGFPRPNVSNPLIGTSYNNRGPNYDLTESMKAGYNNYVDAGINSFWWASYLTCENGHSYFTISGHMPYTAQAMATFLSFLDVNTGYYYGINNATAGTMINNTFHATAGNVEMYNTTEDMWSGFQVTSTQPGAAFNLSLKADGPNLFHGASGTFTFGDGLTNEWAAPTMGVSGFVTAEDGSQSAIISEKSLSWFDRQWGYGAARNGYYWFDIFLDNGVIMALWKTNPEPGTNRTTTFVTVLYPDAHHEIHIADQNIHAAGPWVSKTTNYTWYSSFQLNIPTLSSTIDVAVLHQAGEMAIPGHPTEPTTLYEGYAEFNGTFKGEMVTGFGLSEQLQQINIA
ncbi:hypothetical protein LTS17_006509 [Exophiala oligosperma]